MNDIFFLRQLPPLQWWPALRCNLHDILQVSRTVLAMFSYLQRAYLVHTSGSQLPGVQYSIR